ncbi:hypothetical protein [Stenotrophomonas sp. 278]|uniref:hypothetical protein n=1 Tax=Stenotrophomonas sp. 278 TaxID=2479851 RepID=UPI000F66177C|nr:hypothetical protein [Stenotrophomonas sp. 278]
MANGYQRAGAAIGAALFGNGREAYNDQLSQEYKIAYALEQARKARSDRMIGDQNVASRQGLTPELVGRARAGDVDALNELTALGLTSNANVDMGVLGDTQSFAFRQAARERAVLGDQVGANAELFGLANGPVDTTKISDGVAYNPLGASSQDLNVTPLGEATIRQRDASAASSYATAARTRQATGLDMAKFNRGGGGTLGDRPAKPPTAAQVKADQAAATKSAQLGNVNRGIDRISAALGNLGGAFVDTGPVDQYLVRNTAAGQELEAAVGAIQNSMLALTRVPGVGSQSDLEAKIANLQYPSLSNAPSVNANTMKQLKAFVDELQGITGGAGTLGDMPAAAPARAPGLPDAAPVQRARNPRTGQVLVLRNGQWVPE